MDLGRRLRDEGYRQVLVGSLHVRHAAGTSTRRMFAGSRGSERRLWSITWLPPTTWPAARIMCVMLALGAVLRAVHAIVRGRSGRIREFATSAVTLAFPRPDPQAGPGRAAAPNRFKVPHTAEVGNVAQWACVRWNGKSHGLMWRRSSRRRTRRPRAPRGGGALRLGPQRGLGLWRMCASVGAPALRRGLRACSFWR